MKKIGLFFICGLLLIMVVVWIVYANKNNETHYEIKFVNDLSREKNETYVCVINQDEQLEMIKVELPNDFPKSIGSILKIYNEHRNIIPLGYKTPVINNITISNYEIVGKTLIVTIDELDNKTNILNLAKSWVLTFQNYGIDKIKIKYSGKVYTVDENCNINANSSATGNYQNTFYIKTDLGYIPITYHSLEDNFQATIKCLFDYLDISNVSYEIDNSEECLYLYLNDHDNLVTKEVLKQLEFNLKFMDNKYAVIIKNGIIISEFALK